MIRITKRLAADAKLAPSMVAEAPRLTLPFDTRSKSRLKAYLSDGQEVGLFLPRGTVLRGGDRLVTEAGGIVVVEAASESVMIVHAANPSALQRAAYHLGNRHVPVELGDGYLKLERDHVLREMLIGLGVAVEDVEAPFEPEGGAYGHGHTHAADQDARQHAHHHGHHHHDHGHDHHHHEPGHVHDEHCGHQPAVQTINVIRRAPK